MADGRAGLNQIAPAWVAIVLALAMTLVVTLPFGPTPSMIDLAGQWPATVASETGTFETALQTPGLLVSQGVPNDSLVTIDMQVEIPPEMLTPAVYLDEPRYAIAVWWDGVLVGEQGDLYAEGRAHRTRRRVLLPLPNATAGPHLLSLELRDAYQSGGFLGRMLIGSQDDLQRMGWRQEVDRLGLVLALCVLAIVSLAAAAGRVKRPAHLYFGLFCVALAVWSYFRSDSAHMLSADPVIHFRFRRLAEGFIPPFGVMFLGYFLHGRGHQVDKVFLSLGGLSSLVGLLVAPALLYSVETFQDVLIGTALVWYLFITVRAMIRGVHTSGLMFVASIVPISIGVSHEIMVSHGLVTGSSSLMFLSMLLFLSGSSAALAVRYTQEAERHRRLVERTVDAVVTINTAGRVTDANPAAIMLLGDGLVGRPLSQKVHRKDKAIFKAHVIRGSERPDRAEFVVTLPDGECAMESIATPVDEDTSLLVLRDVTRRRLLDKSILQAARMETLAVLLGGIAHDFNNMLGNLLAHIGLLQATLDDDPTQVRLEKMEGTVERASLLMRRLLTLSGGTSAQLTTVDVTQVCRGAVGLVEPTLPKGVTLELDLPDDLFHALGADRDLEHVVVNLLMNARDAVGDSGTIILTTRNFELDTGLRGVLIVIDDDGPGVPRDLREQIFEPFVTSKGPTRGSGLGLAVASQILRNHHGRIWIEDRTTNGARFCVALRHVQAVEDRTTSMPLHRRVLLVEDEIALLDTFSTALLTAGFEVETCANGTEALRSLQEGAPDILVTDVVMPDVSGLEVATLCRDLYPNVPVLLVSGFIPDRTFERVAGPDWTRLDKPVRTSQLVATVARLRRHVERVANGDEEDSTLTELWPPMDNLTANSVGL